MAYGREEQRVSRLRPLVEAAFVYHVDTTEAQAIVDAQVQEIRDSWDDVCDEGELTTEQRSTFFGGQFLNPFAFET